MKFHDQSCETSASNHNFCLEANNIDMKGEEGSGADLKPLLITTLSFETNNTDMKAHNQRLGGCETLLFMMVLALK
mgnify:FL=1